MSTKLTPTQQRHRAAAQALADAIEGGPRAITVYLVQHGGEAHRPTLDAEALGQARVGLLQLLAIIDELTGGPDDEALS